MAVIVGTIARVDVAAGLIQIGRTELRGSNQVGLDAFVPGTSVTITCEERDGAWWVTAIRRNLY